MRRLMMLALVALLPGPALASTCVSAAEVGMPPVMTLVIDVAPVGSFFTLVGEIVPLPGDPCTAGAPIVGSAHLRGDGKVHFGLMGLSVAPPATDCFAIWLTGTVDPPSYTTGTAFARVHNGYSAPLVLTPRLSPDPAEG